MDGTNDGGVDHEMANHGAESNAKGGPKGWSPTPGAAPTASQVAAN